MRNGGAAQNKIEAPRIEKSAARVSPIKTSRRFYFLCAAPALLTPHSSLLTPHSSFLIPHLGRAFIPNQGTARPGANPEPRNPFLCYNEVNAIGAVLQAKYGRTESYEKNRCDCYWC